MQFERADKNYRSIEAITADIDTMVAEWHADTLDRPMVSADESLPDDGTLHRFLGMTRDEYAAWVEDPNDVPFRFREHLPSEVRDGVHCPKCGRRWPKTCEQVVAIELEHKCFACSGNELVGEKHLRIIEAIEERDGVSYPLVKLMIENEGIGEFTQLAAPIHHEMPYADGKIVSTAPESKGKTIPADTQVKVQPVIGTPKDAIAEGLGMLAAGNSPMVPAVDMGARELSFGAPPVLDIDSCAMAPPRNGERLRGYGSNVKRDKARQLRKKRKKHRKRGR